METSQNPEEFFQVLEVLIERNGLSIDRPKGSSHPRFPQLIYPMDYGFINGTQSQDGEGIDVFLGDLQSHRGDPQDHRIGMQDHRKNLQGHHVVGVLCSIDREKRDSEVKVLVDCTEENIRTALKMLNHGPMRAVLLRRFPNGEGEHQQ
ncbi:MAG: inorganic diphosphatase [Puniceicoccales bacterium]|jgi:inorganic pyrophosphatase|nr:inorganic diphosphatase [Puniceicoccales bacterium]